MSIIEMKVPTIGESITEVTMTKWLKADGEFVSIDDPICEFESDKATLEFPAEASGKLIHVAEEGSDLKIGTLVAKIDTSVKSDIIDNNSAQIIETNTSLAEVNTEVPNTKGIDSLKDQGSNNTYASGTPSPAASKILAEKGIDPSQVQGTGKDGRILKQDAEIAMDSTKASKTEDKSVDPLVPISSIKFSRQQRIEKMSRMRRTIAKRLVSAKNNTAMLTTFNEVDMSGIMALRNKYQDAFVAKYGIKLGFMSLFAKACAMVLMEMPEVNAFIDEEDLILNDYADISIAISTPTGLVVPPVHNVESLQLHEIETKIKELADKARTGKLTLEEMKGGTFTITNGGVFGSMMSTPIINEPQSAILGMHAIINRPIAVNDQVVIRPMMYIALSYDHRVIDGSSSVTFLVKVKKLLEDPTLLLMGLI